MSEDLRAGALLHIHEEDEGEILTHLSKHPDEEFRLIIEIKREEWKSALDMITAIGVKIKRQFKEYGNIVIKCKYQEAKKIHSQDWCQGIWIDHVATCL